MSTHWRMAKQTRKNIKQSLKLMDAKYPQHYRKIFMSYKVIKAGNKNPIIHQQEKKNPSCFVKTKQKLNHIDLWRWQTINV